MLEGVPCEPVAVLVDIHMSAEGWIEALCVLLGQCIGPLVELSFHMAGDHNCVGEVACKLQFEQDVGCRPLSHASLGN